MNMNMNIVECVADASYISDVTHRVKTFFISLRVFFFPSNSICLFD